MHRIVVISLLMIPIISFGSEHETNYRGTYVFGPEVQSFEPCGDKLAYWVSFDWAGIEMHLAYQETREEPYQRMYIEFRGQVLNEVVDGFAEEYDGLIRISEVKKYTFEIPAECN